MECEYEIRFLEIDAKELQNKLKSLGAKFVYDDLFKIRSFWTFENNDRDYIRIRNENDKIILTHKKTKANSIRAEEYEVEVNSIKKAVEFVKSLGYKDKMTLEKRRIKYELDGASIDIDFWPKIPCYVEVEGDSEEHIRKVCSKLGFDYDKGHKGDAGDVFRKYGLDIDNMDKLVFD